MDSGRLASHRFITARVILPPQKVEFTVSGHGKMLESFVVCPFTGFYNPQIKYRGVSEKWEGSNDVADPTSPILKMPLQDCELQTSLRLKHLLSEELTRGIFANALCRRLAQLTRIGIFRSDMARS